MKAYKLTDKLGRTKHDTQWGVGVSRRININIPGSNLCTSNWYHFYSHPILGLIMNPAHGNFVHPRLWVGEAGGAIKTEDGTKHGCTTLTIMEELMVPEISVLDIKAFAYGVIMHAVPTTFLARFVDGRVGFEEAYRHTTDPYQRSWLSSLTNLCLAGNDSYLRASWASLVANIAEVHRNIPFAKIIEATIPIR